MNNLNLIIITTATELILLSVLLYFFSRKIISRNIEKFEDLHKKISEDIKYAISPKFIELSVEINDLVDLAVEVWRIENRITKSISELSENQLKGLENSLQKLRRYLEKYDIDIVDYKNTKYNDGLNLDILSIEKDSSITESRIKEVIEPTIMCKGQVVRRAKIILLTNQ
jgi:hypothetical protein